MPLRFSIFSKPSYKCWWNCVSADKAQSALSAETKFHIQKCNTCRYKRIYREAKSQNFLLYNGTVLSKVVFTAVYILILEYIHVTCYYGFSTAVHVQQCSTKFSIVLARPRGRQLQSSNRMNHPWNHRGIGPRSSQVRGYWWPCSRRWPLGGCRREIYENESTPKFAAENMRRCKSCFESFCFRLKLSFLSYTVLCVNL